MFYFESVCNYIQELSWSLLLNSSDEEVDVIGAVVDVCPAFSERLSSLLNSLFYFSNCWMIQKCFSFENIH